MRQSHYISDPPQVEHPQCQECGVPMWLTQLEPDKPDHDKRTFHCKACGMSVIKIVKYK